MPRLLVIVASTRPGRVGKPVADWFVAAARSHGGFEVEVADLLELDLPLFDEAKHPMLGEYEHAHTKAWAEIVAAADAVVLVMPEYNHSYTAPLKNAIDYLHAEWADKAVGVVSYGGIAAGIRAVQAIKPVLAVLKAVPITPAVNIPFVKTFMEDGTFVPNDVLTDAVPTMLDELLRLDGALRTLR